MKKTLLVLAVIALAGCSKGSGERVGALNTVGIKMGPFNTCPTWEGEIVRGGLSNGSGASGKPFDFTIADEKQAHELQSLLGKDIEIKLHYHHEGWTFCRSESDGYFLDSYEVVTPGVKPAANGLTQVNDPSVLQLMQQQEVILDRVTSILEKQNAAHN